MKCEFPVILIFARDWQLYQERYPLKENFEISTGWITGFLIEEKEDAYIVAAEYFPFKNDDDYVRYIQAIPKETVIYKKIIKQGK